MDDVSNGYDMNMWINDSTKGYWSRFSIPKIGLVPNIDLEGKGVTVPLSFGVSVPVLAQYL